MVRPLMRIYDALTSCPRQEAELSPAFDVIDAVLIDDAISIEIDRLGLVAFGTIHQRHGVG